MCGVYNPLENSKRIRLLEQLNKSLYGYTEFDNFPESPMSRSKKVDLIYFSFRFYFLFDVFFYFLFLEQLRLGLIGHAVTSVTN